MNKEKDSLSSSSTKSASSASLTTAQQPSTCSNRYSFRTTTHEARGQTQMVMDLMASKLPESLKDLIVDQQNARGLVSIEIAKLQQELKQKRTRKSIVKNVTLKDRIVHSGKLVSATSIANKKPQSIDLGSGMPEIKLHRLPNIYTTKKRRPSIDVAVRTPQIKPRRLANTNKRRPSIDVGFRTPQVKRHRLANANTINKRRPSIGFSIRTPQLKGKAGHSHNDAHTSIHSPPSNAAASTNPSNDTVTNKENEHEFNTSNKSENEMPEFEAVWVDEAGDNTKTDDEHDIETSESENSNVVNAHMETNFNGSASLSSLTGLDINGDSQSEGTNFENVDMDISSNCVTDESGCAGGVELNESPTSLSLSAGQLEENAENGQLIGLEIETLENTPNVICLFHLFHVHYLALLNSFHYISIIGRKSN